MEGTYLYYLFYLLVVVETLIFIYAISKLFLKYRKGSPDAIQRLSFKTFFFRAFFGIFNWSSHKKIDKSDRKILLAHQSMILGLFILFLGTVYISINQDILILLFDINTFFGSFYQIFSFLMELAGLVAVFSAFYLVYRRASRPKRLDYARADKRDLNPARNKWIKEDNFFNFFIIFSLFTGFFLETVRIVADSIPDYEIYSFIAYPLAYVLQPFFTLELAESVYLYTWWFHFFQSVFFFAVIIPYTKGMHMLTAYLSIITRDTKAGLRLPPKLESKEDYGYKTIKDLSWRDLISLDACTKCGRCHISCPAQIVGHPLSPRDLILDLREHAAVTLGSPEYSFRNKSTNKTVDQLLVLEEENPTILPETIWSCTTCMACITMCPVGIEHIPLIVQLRRGLIEEGVIDNGISGVLEKVGKYGNSFGKSAKQRSRWSKKLDFKIKDARKEKVDFLWYVGDFASFDQRVQEDTQKVAKIFNHAGLDFGILHDGEKTTGNDIRRVGEEGLFEMLLEDNLEVLKNAEFSRIVTTDPHTLNSLRNEYTEFDSSLVEEPYKSNIIHYTTLLWQLVKEKKLIIKKKFSGTVTYHDPCFLGRYSGEFDAPRNLILAMGFELIDMPRCKENGFCCGAGGGMIWNEDIPAGDRPALNRMREAETVNASKFIVACPKDKVMFSDAVKDFPMEVIDVANLLFESLEIPIPEINTEESKSE